MQSDQICHYLPLSLRNEIEEAKTMSKRRTTLLQGIPKQKIKKEVRPTSNSTGTGVKKVSEKVSSDFEL